MRAGDGQDFAQWLLKLGHNQLKSSEPTSPPMSIDIPGNANIVTEDLVNAVFPDLSSPQSFHKLLLSVQPMTILCS